MGRLPQKRVWLGICVAAIVLGATVSWWASRQIPRRVYRIGYNHNPPNQIRNPDGTVTGFAVDATNAAARRAGIRLEWVFDPSSTGELLWRGEVDLWPILMDLPERRSKVHISDHWMVNEHYLLSRGESGVPPAGSFGGEVHYANPAVNGRHILKVWPRAKPVLHADVASMVPLFCAGAISHMFLSSQYSGVQLRALSHECPRVEFRAHHLPELTIRLGTAAQFAHAAVADRIREEILRMGEDGELGQILARYAFVGLSESRMILQMVAIERQARYLRWALEALGYASLGLFWLIWRLRRARLVALQASVAKGEFLANMSHEIRTPLAGVIGMVQLALDAPLTAEQREQLTTAHSSAHTLLSILNDILDFSKIDARRLDLAPVDTSLPGLVGDVAGLLTPAASRKGIDFQVAIDPSLPAYVHIDPVRLKQVLLNLTGNAIKFTARGYVRIQVSEAAGKPPADGLRLQFTVEDTGEGIPREKQDLVFEAFRQADGGVARLHGGTGLGLSISRNLVEMMGGRMWLESEPGQGSRFSFTVLAGRVSEAAALAAAAAREPAAAPVVARPLRVLVAEDTHVNRRLIEALLVRDGHDVTLADSGREAVELVSAPGARFDLILMDIQMPEMDGFQATAAIRALANHPLRAIPIVALTAHALHGYGEVCRAAGMNAYLTKPIDRNLLRQTLAEIDQARGAGLPEALAILTERLGQAGGRHCGGDNSGGDRCSGEDRKPVGGAPHGERSPGGAAPTWRP